MFFEDADAVAARFRSGMPEPHTFDGSASAVIGRMLVMGRVRDIVSALHGPVQGLLGALNRLGGDPLPQTAYRSLVHLLTAPEHKTRAKALQQLDKIDLSTLSALRWLHPSFVHTDFVRRFRSVEKVEQFNAAIELIHEVAPHVTDEELAESIKALGPSSDLGSWVKRWLAKGVFPVAQEIADDAEWTGLRSAEAMHDAAVRFSNCLRTKVPLVALGRSFYLEYRPAPVVIELAGLSQGKWLAEGLYGPKNGPVDPDAVRAIRQKLEQAGILIPAHLGVASRFNKAAKLMHISSFSSLNVEGFEMEPDDVLDAPPDILELAELLGGIEPLSALP
ncbi:hypothetical protein [Microvirga aerilata]|uniref:hypothetical protein n=1 Tax=Microvirga aerilata TaxID=670292 RepID=UPI0019216086|nr:hypothetical protein [Microvirga aerilata]